MEEPRRDRRLALIAAAAGNAVALSQTICRESARLVACSQAERAERRLAAADRAERQLVVDDRAASRARPARGAWP